MERHRHDRRKRSPLSSVWVQAFAALFMLYVLFVVKVQFYASSTVSSANAIGGEDIPKGHLTREMAEATQAPAPVLAQAAMPTRPVATRKPGAPPADVVQAGAITKKPAAVVAAKDRVVVADSVKADEKTHDAAPVPTEHVGPAIVVTRVEDPLQDAKMPTDHPQAVPVIPKATEEVRTAAPIIAAPKDPFNGRHQTLAGYDETMDFLAKYKVRPGESLFLFFMCSDKKFRRHDWSDECVDARKTVYDVFAKSPPGNRLVTVYAGTEVFWEYQNKFRSDRDLRVKTVPAVMQWHGKGETSGMMIGESLSEEPFLRYLFKNTDVPDQFLNAAAMVQTKTIETVSSHDAYLAKLEAYKAEPKPRNPLFLLFISGRLVENNRPWCPYCRFSELPMEYGFYAFAPPNSRLLRVEVTPTYQEWKTPNKYNRDPALGPLRGVPGFFTVQQLASQELKMDRLYERFDRLATLKNLFLTAALRTE